jgi:hypothetical protein
MGVAVVRRLRQQQSFLLPDNCSTLAHLPQSLFDVQIHCKGDLLYFLKKNFFIRD